MSEKTATTKNIHWPTLFPFLQSHCIITWRRKKYNNISAWGTPRKVGWTENRCWRGTIDISKWRFCMGRILGGIIRHYCHVTCWTLQTVSCILRIPKNSLIIGGWLSRTKHFINISEKILIWRRQFRKILYNSRKSATMSILPSCIENVGDATQKSIKSLAKKKYEMPGQTTALFQFGSFSQTFQNCENVTFGKCDVFRLWCSPNKNSSQSTPHSPGVWRRHSVRVEHARSLRVLSTPRTAKTEGRGNKQRARPLREDGRFG